MRIFGYEIRKIGSTTPVPEGYSREEREEARKFTERYEAALKRKNDEVWQRFLDSRGAPKGYKGPPLP